MTDAKKLKVVRWPIEKLIPYERNAKKHPPEQIRKIANAIKKFGFTDNHAIAVDKDGVIINGHGRRLAAIELGLKDVPVIVRNDLTESQARAYRLADNEVARSELDTLLLSSEMQDLGLSDDVDMSDFFDAKDFDFLSNDMGAMNDAAISDSLQSEVEDHNSDVDARIDEENDKLYPLRDAFKFAKINGEQRRNLTLLLAYAEGETGQEGAEALSQLGACLMAGS